jgi:hypothetical protein
LTKIGVHRKAKTTVRKQSVIKESYVKLLTQNFFSVKSIYKCVIDEESYFTVEGNQWHQQSHYESDYHPATEDIQFIDKTEFSAKVLLWLPVSEYDVSEPVFFKSGLDVKMELYSVHIQIRE